MARRIHPPRAVALPFAQGFRAGFRCAAAAALVAAVTLAAGPEVLIAGKIAEAEANVGKPHRLVRVAFAGADGIAESRDQQVAHGDFGGCLLDAAVRRHDADAGDGRLAIAQAHGHVLAAIDGDALHGDGAVVKIPGTTRSLGHLSGEHGVDAVIFRGEIILGFAVTLADIAQPARGVDAKPIDHVLRPAAAVTCAFHARLRGADAVLLQRGDLALEIGIVAEQAETIFHLPFNA